MRKVEIVEYETNKVIKEVGIEVLRPTFQNYQLYYTEITDIFLYQCMIPYYNNTYIIANHHEHDFLLYINTAKANMKLLEEIYQISARPEYIQLIYFFFLENNYSWQYIIMLLKTIKDNLYYVDACFSNCTNVYQAKDILPVVIKEIHHLCIET